MFTHNNIIIGEIYRYNLTKTILKEGNSKRGTTQLLNKKLRFSAFPLTTKNANRDPSAITVRVCASIACRCKVHGNFCCILYKVQHSNNNKQ